MERVESWSRIGPRELAGKVALQFGFEIIRVDTGLAALTDLVANFGDDGFDVEFGVRHGGGF